MTTIVEEMTDIGEWCDNCHQGRNICVSLGECDNCEECGTAPVDWSDTEKEQN